MSKDINVGLKISANMGNTMSQLRGLSQTLSGVGSVLQGATAIALAKSLSNSTLQAANMNKEFARMQNTSGLASEEIQALQRHAHKLAKQTGIGAENLTNAFSTLASSGLSTDGVKDSVEAISLAALSAGANIDQLAEALNTISRNFDIDLNMRGSAEQILDQISAAIAHGNGNVSFDELTAFAKRNAQRAMQAGLSLPDLLSFTQAVSNTTGNASESRRQVESLMQLITGDSLHKVGIETFDRQGNRLPFEQILQNISAKYDKYAENDQWETHFINTAFGGNRYMATLIRQMQDVNFSEEFKSGAQYIENASGRLRSDAENASRNIATQLNRTREIINSLKNVVGNAIDRTATDPLTSLNNFVKEKPTEALIGTAVAGTALAGVLHALSKAKGGNIAGALSGGVSLGAGVVKGNILNQIAGVQPVFVVNMPSAGMLNPTTPPVPPRATPPVVPPAAGGGLGGLLTGAKTAAASFVAPAAAVLGAIAPIAIAGGALHYGYSTRDLTREERDYRRLQNNPRASQAALDERRRLAEASRARLEQRTDVYVHIEADKGLSADHRIEENETIRWYR